MTQRLKFNTLNTRIMLVFLLLIVLCSGGTLYFSKSTSQAYGEEVMQRLNQSVAMYVAGQQPLIRNGIVDHAAMDELASRAMVINPSLEIYLVNPSGGVITHRLPVEDLATPSIDMQAVRSFLSPDVILPIYGTNPSTQDGRTVFSVAPVKHKETLEGYVYAVIGGERYKSLQHSVERSGSLRVGTTWLLSVALITALVGSLLFYLLTRRVSHLRRKVELLDGINLGVHSEEVMRERLDSITNPNHAKRRRRLPDDLTELDQAFTNIALHINQQFDALKSMDGARRELIANVSHDLRTPLASMQGYIETLLIKDDTVSKTQRREYLQTAFKHSKRLSNLVTELFELATLETQDMEPKMEQFSVLELVHDTAQEFGLSAQDHQIDLTVNAEQDCQVIADIALIHRVLQNLIDNALRHTPAGGRIEISVSEKNSKAVVTVSDTGSGIKTQEIPYIFKRFYQSQQQNPSDRLGTGLGLAIVKRILDLHKSNINVKSQIDRGTSFIFELPQYA